MPRRPEFSRRWISVAAALSGVASAHGFEGSGWVHPLTGADHLLAMVAVGLWSAQIGGRALYVIPAAFLLAMALGAGLGLMRFPLFGVEPLIAFSVVGLGYALVRQVPFQVPVALLTVGLFGMAHGFAHGEAFTGVQRAGNQVAGFLITTAGLHLVGAFGGLLVLELEQGRRLLRWGGGWLMLAGFFLLGRVFDLLPRLPL